MLKLFVNQTICRRIIEWQRKINCVWKETVVAQLKLLPLYLSEGMKEMYHGGRCEKYSELCHNAIVAFLLDHVLWKIDNKNKVRLEKNVGPSSKLVSSHRSQKLHKGKLAYGNIRDTQTAFIYSSITLRPIRSNETCSIAELTLYTHQWPSPIEINQFEI
jgi:hypothetical protein